MNIVRYLHTIDGKLEIHDRDSGHSQKLCVHFLCTLLINMYAYVLITDVKKL